MNIQCNYNEIFSLTLKFNKFENVTHVEYDLNGI